MKFIVSIFFLFSAMLPLTAHGAETATDILNRTASKISSAPSIRAKYALVSPEHGAVNGNITISGEKFTTSTPELTTWYNGSTQWTYVVSDNEVTISEPTPEELPQINPFLIINNFTRSFTPTLLQSRQADEKKVNLKAKNKKSRIESAILTVNAKTYLPVSISMVLDDKSKVTIDLQDVTIGKRLQSSTFTFDKKHYPKVEIIDLR